MGSIISKYEEDMSDREIMNAKGGLKVPKKLKTPPNLNSSPVEIFEHEYPELSNEFKQIQNEMYEMFARKHMDYGLNNIALGGDIVNNRSFSRSRQMEKIVWLKNFLVL